MGALLQGPDQSPQRLSSSAGCRSSYKIDWEKAHRATDQLPIPVATDQHSDPPISEKKGHHEEAAVPKRNDRRRFFIIPSEKRLQDLGVGLLNPHGESKKLEESIGEKRDDKKEDTLSQFPQEGFSSLGHCPFIQSLYAVYSPCHPSGQLSPIPET